MTDPRYFERLRIAAAEVAGVLEGKGVAAARLCFGGEGTLPEKKPRIPVDANSNFLGNRAMGDWAESAIQELLAENLTELQPVPYGDSNRMAAGDPGFRDYY